jgi:hypothetical protein
MFLLTLMGALRINPDAHVVAQSEISHNLMTIKTASKKSASRIGEWTI